MGLVSSSRLDTLHDVGAFVGQEAAHRAVSILAAAALPRAGKAPQGTLPEGTLPRRTTGHGAGLPTVVVGR
jgi:hypothetical protein